MRVNEVEKSLKDQGECGRCHDGLPKGSAYRWIKGRYSARKVRCMKPSCRFRQSEMTESKLSGLYAAQEEAQDQIETWTENTEADDMRSVLETMREGLQAVADEYRESAENIRETFSESATADECEEKAESIEEWISSIEDVENDIEEFKVDDETTLENAKEQARLAGLEFDADAEREERNENDQSRETWYEETVSAVQDIVNENPL